MTTVHLNPSSIDDYRQFLAIKSLPSFSCRGREMRFPDEYNSQILGGKTKRQFTNWKPSDFLFDYQRDIVQMALRKRKYAIFADCGAGKTLMFLEWLHAVRTRLPKHKRALIVSPLMVIPQTLDENDRWYSKTGFPIEQTDTLNVREAKGKDDTKHICPLQLGLIHRLVKLYTNRNEIVFSPFAGIGSEGYEALKQGRRFYGCELKQEYFDCACDNLSSVVAESSKQMLLFGATP